MNKIIFSIITSFIVFISGCVSSTLILSSLAIKTSADPRSIGTQIDNFTLKVKIYKSILQNDLIKTKESRISVIPYENKILIIGQVPNNYLFNHVQKIVQSFDYDKEIYNEIRIKNKISFMQNIKDSWISSQSYFYLIKSKNIKTKNLKILTENGEVFLLGNASQKEIKNIIKIISNIKGVNCIINIL
ncbi:yraP [Wigglesworthia glossinidia endosymbiont of Glossina brevipalpis]|uniref:YraP protein n=1 Tax=Wigglesworthia glossinidia brevipalpis TaxID=36870 RepID=Q8D2A3_WIGBR|nr:yraP [Wigglesworthia glossinidia endosymbiont of Glossina brevipalpis]